MQENKEPNRQVPDAEALVEGHGKQTSKSRFSG